MNSVIAFLLLCIPARIGIALASQYVPEAYLKFYAIYLLITGLSFIYLFFSNSRLDAPEAGGKTWWANYRLIIGMLWLTASIYAFQGKRNLIWIPLAIDIVFGIIIFAIKRLKLNEGN
jgi:hypothetical protein